MGRTFTFRRAATPARTHALKLGLGVACAMSASASHAACDNYAPASGQTVTCDTRAPNPSGTPVVAASGSTNVTVNITAGAQIEASGNHAVTVRDASTVTNLGSLSLLDSEQDAITAQGTGAGHDTLVNGGTIITLGQDSDGLSTTSPASLLRNATTGVITTLGVTAAGLHDDKSAGSNVLQNDGKIVSGGLQGFGIAAMSNGDTLVNNGSIVTSGSGGDGMHSESRSDIESGNNILTNNGTIVTTSTDAAGMRALEPFPGTITNNGSVFVQGNRSDGVFTAGSASVVNAPGAQIVSLAGSGVNQTRGGTLTNASLIEGATGVSASGDAESITNTGTGTIRGTTVAGIESDSALTLVNQGVIEGQWGVLVPDSAPGPKVDITNSGTITGLSTVGIVAYYGGTIANTGLIRGNGGVLSTLGLMTIDNQGTIDGMNALGIEAGSGVNIDNSGLIRGGSTAGIFLTGGMLKLINSGTVDGNLGAGIDAGGGAQVDNRNVIRGTTGMTVAGGLTQVKNTGSIEGTSGIGMLANQGAEVQNSGTITGTTGLSVFGSMTTVTNSGTIAGTTGPGILARKSASVDNTGTIRGTTGLSVVGGLAIVNNGAGGTITGTRYSGIGAVDGLTLDNRGIIQGTAGVSVTAAGASITNTGSILATTGAAVASVNGTAIENSNLIHGMTGVSVTDGLANITNNGQIVGVRGAALTMNSGGTVTNGAGAVISGGSAGIVAKTDETLTFSTTFNNRGSMLSASGAAISTEGRTSIANTGLVQGAQGLTSNGSLSLSNDGTMRGTSGPAILVTGANDSTISSTGTIAGGNGVAISTGAGSDYLGVYSGLISGAVQQGDNYDYVNLFGGQMDSLDGGAGYNSFTIQGGRVVGAVIDEDQVQINGGRIGSIRMHDVNGTSFAMVGGIVDGDVTFGASDDTIISLQGGFIDGHLDLGDGNNAATIAGTSIAKGISSGSGSDALTWTSGSVAGPITLGAGSDSLSIQNQTLASTGALTLVDGGADIDALSLTRSQMNNLGRLLNWEIINVGSSQLTFDANGLKLGDAGTRTGSLNVDQTSTLFAGGVGTTGVQPAVAGQRVVVNNSGTIDLTNGGTSTRDAFVINGNYTGYTGSRLLLQTVLGTDNSPSDKLVVSQGTASGTTQVSIVNVGGIGGLTSGNGILVVEAINGANTAASAFSLAGAVEAGAYRYLLFKGGTSAEVANNWYLRSSMPAATPASTTSAAAMARSAQTSSNEPALPLASTVAAAAPVPIYRMEVPVYAEMPQIARELTVQQIGTFHERQGAQALLTESGALPASWSRVWGGHDTLRSTGAADPRFSGGIGGVQVGQDIYADASASGQRNHYGFFVGFARASGDISGFALAVPDSDAGHLSMNAYSAGAYWTHTGPGGWYTDAVVMGSALEADPSSDRGVGASTHGKALAASLEAGLPVPLTAAFGIEPQVQLMWQHATLNDFNDGISNVSIDEASGLIGRLGVRLFGHFDAAGTAWEPYVRTDVLRYFGATGTATFAGTDVVPTSVSATTVRVGAGIVAKVSARGSLFANMNYSVNANGAHRSAIEGGAGVRWAW